MAKKKRYYQSSMSSADPRRASEAQDSRMISEDRSAPANLPQQVKYHEWPDTGYSRYHLDDTINGIDRQIDSDLRKPKKDGSKEMY